jgi:uncharacterized protein YggE
LVSVAFLFYRNFGDERNMKKPKALGLMAIATLTWMVPSVGQAAEQSMTVGEVVSMPADDRPQLLAQMFYPSANQDEQAVMVLGQGQASVPADTAKIVLNFSSYDPYAEFSEGLILFQEPPATGRLANHESAPVDAPPLTEVMLRPVVEAIEATGVAADQIEVEVSDDPASDYSTGNLGSVIVTLTNPGREQVERIVAAGTNAVSDRDNVYFQDVSVAYAVDDCQALTQAVYSAAVADAQDRASAIASAMGVEIGDVPSIAESPFGLLSSTCADASAGSVPMPFPFNYGTSYYDPEAPAEVELRRDVFVTYPIR